MKDSGFYGQRLCHRLLIFAWPASNNQQQYQYRRDVVLASIQRHVIYGDYHGLNRLTVYADKAGL